MRAYTTKAVTLPDDHWRVLEEEAFLALMHPDKLMAHALRLMQFDEKQARAGLRRVYVNDKGQVQQPITAGLPAFD